MEYVRNADREQIKTNVRSVRINMKKQRTMALVISVFILVISLFSTFFIAEESNHDCTGQDCPICACIQQAEQTVKNLGSGILSEGLGLAIAGIVAILLIEIEIFVPASSPVAQKVRMNN